jgi:hypothetical protein
MQYVLLSLSCDAGHHSSRQTQPFPTAPHWWPLPQQQQQQLKATLQLQTAGLLAIWRLQQHPALLLLLLILCCAAVAATACCSASS